VASSQPQAAHTAPLEGSATLPAESGAPPAKGANSSRVQLELTGKALVTEGVLKSDGAITQCSAFVSCSGPEAQTGPVLPCYPGHWSQGKLVLPGGKVEMGCLMFHGRYPDAHDLSAATLAWLSRHRSSCDTAGRAQRTFLEMPGD